MDSVGIKESGEGLYQKYNIEKSDGTPVDPKAQYFVLRVDGDEPHIKASHKALRAYCEHIREHHIVELLDLADDLNKLLNANEKEADND